MYYPNQVVWSVERKEPVQIGSDVWNTDSYPKGRTRPFIDADGKTVCPKSVEHANILLQRGRIVPSPIPKEWCWSCDTRLSDKPKDSCVAIDEHVRCAECNAYGIYGTVIGNLVCMRCHGELEKNGLRVVAEELLQEITLIKNRHDEHGNRASKLIAQLVELDDPYSVNRDGRIRDEFDAMYKLRVKERRAAKKDNV